MDNNLFSKEKIDPLLRPKTVALVGASNKSVFSIGIYAGLKKFSKQDATYLVNVKGVVTHGCDTYTSIKDVPAQIDLAVLMVPQPAVQGVLAQCAGVGVKSVAVLSSGYGEMGPEGKQAERELVETALDLGMLVLGPNMLGFLNWVDGIPVMPVDCEPFEKPAVALLSQSGASAGAMIDFAKMIDVQLSYAVSLGNEAMVTSGHLIDYLVEDESTKAIALFMEAIREPEVFLGAARRAIKAGKAVVVLKVGTSEKAALSAAAHTGALVGDDRVIDAVFREAGVIRVDSIEDMVAVAGAAAYLGPLENPGIGISSISGGACDIISDYAEEYGAELTDISSETKDKLGGIFSSLGTAKNPLDLTGEAIINPSIYTDSIKILGDDPGVGVVGLVHSVPWEGKYEDVAGPLIDGFVKMGEGIRDAKVPTLFINQTVRPVSDVSRAIMRDMGVTFMSSGLDTSMTALAEIGRWSQRRLEILNDGRKPERLDLQIDGKKQGAWSEQQVRRLLGQAGIPVVPAEVATTADQACEVANRLGTAVSVKIVSPDIIHKSDIGGVQLNVDGEEAVRANFKKVMDAGRRIKDARIEGALISPMRSPSTELLIGVVRDPDFGLMLSVALGGVFVELMDDSALRPVPVSHDGAGKMLDELKGGKILDGFRGSPAADRNKLADVMSRVGDLALALGDELLSLEINPLRVEGSRIEALDAVIEWRN